MVFISAALKAFYLGLNKNIKFTVQHDGHANEVVDQSQLTEYFQDWSRDRKIEIGYFGRFSNKKGSELLAQLIESMPYAQFTIGTLNKNNLKAKNIVENKF